MTATVGSHATQLFTITTRKRLVNHETQVAQLLTRLDNQQSQTNNINIQLCEQQSQQCDAILAMENHTTRLDDHAAHLESIASHLESQSS